MNTENNKLIADFLGYKVQTDPTEKWFGQYFKPNYGWVSEKELDFDSDWNSIMPVVEKIEGLKATVKMARHWGANVEDEVEDMYFCIIQPFENIEEIDVAWKDSKIEAVYKAVLEYIKWYNQNK